MSKIAIAAATVVALMVGNPKMAKAEPVVSSFYGEELRGSLTADGTPFDPDMFSAAHRTLPLGTLLTVCYDGCVVVVVNDRGPYVDGRHLDLSQGAAQAIGLDEEGVDVVEMYW